MIDKSKVIKGLECCSKGGCVGCPYGNDCETNDNFVQLAKDALELLENAIIVRPQWIVCRDCAHWDSKSGLTARRCDMHDIITKQSDWCSKAVKRKC